MLKSDRWIRKSAQQHDMINPFSEEAGVRVSPFRADYNSPMRIPVSVVVALLVCTAAQAQEGRLPASGDNIARTTPYSIVRKPGDQSFSLGTSTG
jgi:hypothetical protein